MSAFPHLSAPGHLGDLEVANRIVMPAMDMNLSDEGHVTDPEIDHYVARAAGGTGLVILGTGAVAWPVGATSRHQPAFSADEFLPGLRRLADAIHAAGGRVCAQLCHHGKTAGVDTADGRPLLVPSVVRYDLDQSALQDNTLDELVRLSAATGGKAPTYREATDEDLARVIDAFADAAARARSAGIDAVEVHAAHGYLLSTFLSPGYNHRTDDWGGSVERRARLTCAVVQAIRQRVGPGYPVIVRINGHEYGPEGGITAPEAARAAALIEAAGADAIHVSACAHNAFADFTDGPLPGGVGQYREYTRAVKAAVSVPVIAVGRILPELAEEMLAAGECDFVALGRQQLADPDLARKITTGDREAVRPCINCYVCVEQNFFDATPRCAVNPALGDEAAAPVAPTASPRHVVVVGAGPAGLEAARRAALAGHRVTVLERSNRLGGTARFSAVTTPANGQIVRWLEHEIRRSTVTVRLGTEASVADVVALAPDVVLLATGAHRPRPDVPGAGLPHVRSGDDLKAMLTGDGPVDVGLVTRLTLTAGRALGLTGDADRVRTWSKRWMPLGRNVVVIGGSLVGLELAEFLAERGRSVTLVEAGANVGLPMAMPRRWTAVGNARRHGVTILRTTTVVEIRPHEVVVRDAEGTTLAVPATDVVVARATSGGELAEPLRAAGLDVRVIGDAAEVGYLEGAFHTAWAAAAAL